MAHCRQTYVNWSTVVDKRLSDHRRYYHHSQSNTRRERRPSPNKHLPQMYEFSRIALLGQATPASRAWKATRGFPNGCRVIRGTAVVTAVQGYTLKSAYHTVVGDKELVDNAQTTGILSVAHAPKRSAEFFAVKLLAP